ncbi:uncharacterized protein LOC115034219 [Rhizophagus clarus]|uniref:Uncharacterized protein LOC115034219 n=1 Tax=Rhizophagus clarus TaxID=94130 RepID=A0A8H3L6H3_9GLOM|nr:uncharacterized protein LOC115034219 [Rhizophagus clarus]
MKKTLNGSNFLIKNSTIGCDRILIFTIVENLKQLEISLFWIMDEMFKTVPTIFKQLYTIHGCVRNENLCIMPLIYVLMTSKSEQCYRTNEEFSLLIRLIPALAFLPFNEISSVFNELKENMTVKANEIMNWFENYYVYRII